MFHIASPSETHPTRKLLDALGAARQRGVSVRVLMDQDRKTDPYLSTIINTPARKLLEAANVPVRFDTAERLLHSKFLVIDQTVAVIGSHNWSAGSFFNFDDLTLVISSPELAAELTQRFVRLWGTG
jgi:phosphatidylserine/phosphatidylglycerophosphate/cardiolipin synthase-like enzyme